MELGPLSESMLAIKVMIIAMAKEVGPIAISVVGIVLVWKYAIRQFRTLIGDKVDFYKNYHGFYDDGIEEIEDREMDEIYREDLSGDEDGYEDGDLY